MKIALGCDHGGIVLKDSVLKTLDERNIEVVDYGTDSADSVDYPIYAEKVAMAVQSGECELGILLCGTGIGMSIAANKFKGIRAAAVSDIFAAKATREHNDSNVLALGGRLVSPEFASSILAAWLDASFAGGRHLKRVDMVRQIEDTNFK